MTVPTRNLCKTRSREMWLRKHADYQRVYREGKRQSLPLMTYFFAPRKSRNADGNVAAPSGMETLKVEPDCQARPGSRVGLTAGKVLGNAVERNRIKRRMREAVRHAQSDLTASVDVVLHPRRTVLEAEFSEIERDVVRAFRAVELAMKKTRGAEADSLRE